MVRSEASRETGTSERGKSTQREKRRKAPRVRQSPSDLSYEGTWGGARRLLLLSSSSVVGVAVRVCVSRRPVRSPFATPCELPHTTPHSHGIPFPSPKQRWRL